MRSDWANTHTDTEKENKCIYVSLMRSLMGSLRTIKAEKREKIQALHEYFTLKQNPKCDSLLAEKGSNTLFIHLLTKMEKIVEKREDVVAQTIHGFEYGIVEVTLMHAHI